MESVTLQVLLSSQPREILLYSLVQPSFFTKQTWKLLCKEVLFSSWSEYKHVSINPRRRFVEIAYRKGLQGELGCDLYSGEYQVLFAMFRREREELQKLAQRFPGEARSLFYKLEAKKENFFLQRELYTVGEAVSVEPHVTILIVAQAETREPMLVNTWSVRTRLLINGDEQSLAHCKQLAFPKSYPGEKLEKLILRGQGSNILQWLHAYSFSKDDSMIEKLLKKAGSSLGKGLLKEIAMNLFTTGNFVMFGKLEREYVPLVYFTEKVLSFEEKLHCLTNYYLYTGDDQGFYKSLLQVMKEKQPLTKDSNIIFEVELYEVRELLRREGIENPLTQNFL
jgi:hypothetical protein